MATESAWQRFRRWRRSRPFWGGLFLLLSALELFLSANLTLKDLQVHIGQEGYLSYLLPAILVLCGILSWVSPGQRLFYGILGLLTALYSFLGLNLGGFGLGMLIGIVGGALTVSWGPPRAKPGGATEPGPEDDQSAGGDSSVGERDEDRPDSVPADPEYATREHPDAEHEDQRTTAILPGFAEDDNRRHREPGPPSDGGVHRKLMVITLLPLALTATLLLAGSHTAARAATDCPEGLPSRSATATAAKDSAAKESAAKASAAKKSIAKKSAAKKATTATNSGGATPTPTPTPTPAPTASSDDGTGNPIVDGWNDFVDGVSELLGIGGDESPSPSASADPSPSAGTDPSPSHSATPTPAGSTNPSTPGSPEGSASPSPKPTPPDVPCLGPRVFKDATPAGEPSVSIAGGLLEGESLNMYDSTYDGTVDLQTADGPLKVLKFSMSKAVTEPFSLTIAEQGGHRTVITTNQLTIKDNVKFYTPNFQGKLYGLFPVTFTPDSPPPFTLPWLYFSDVKINLALVACDTLTAKPLLHVTEVS